MLATAVVAALSFSAPPSLTRRDMMVGFGAAAAVTFKAPAFAANKELTKAEQKAATEEALKALDFKLDPSVKSLQPSTFNPNAVVRQKIRTLACRFPAPALPCPVPHSVC